MAEQTLLREERVLLDKETLEQPLLEIAEPVVVARAVQGWRQLLALAGMAEQELFLRLLALLSNMLAAVAVVQFQQPVQLVWVLPGAEPVRILRQHPDLLILVVAVVEPGIVLTQHLA